jgi:UDP-N-acetylmuramate dehydrogenase
MTSLLADLTTLRLGGPIAQLRTVTDPAGWAQAAATVRHHQGLPLIIGAGSNIIASDHDHSSLVIRLATRGITVTRGGEDHADVTVQAGEPLDELVGFAAANRLSGIEYLAGIPGTAGAAPVQNTGAYGQQISDTLTTVTAWDWNARTLTRIPASACRLAHRSSMFKTTSRWTILAITLRLRQTRLAAPVTYQHLARALDLPLGSTPDLTDAVTAVRADRNARGLSLPSSGPDARQAGSVFVNPPVSASQAAAIRAAGGPVSRDEHGQDRASAGWLLQHSGYQPGTRIAAGVHCSTRRSLTVVARGPVTSTQYTDALAMMTARVLADTGICLTMEPVLVTKRQTRTLFRVADASRAGTRAASCRRWNPGG